MWAAAGECARTMPPLKAICPTSCNACGRAMPVRHIAKYQDVREGDCPFLPTKCELGCGAMVPRKLWTV